MLPNRTILGPDLFPIQMELIFGLKSPACLLFSAIPTHQLQTAFSYVPEGGTHATEVYSPLGWFGRVQVFHILIR
jgi:hypothetical protein